MGSEEEKLLRSQKKDCVNLLKEDQLTEFGEGQLVTILLLEQAKMVDQENAYSKSGSLTLRIRLKQYLLNTQHRKIKRLLGYIQ